jgi:hypothetical protein
MFGTPLWHPASVPAPVAQRGPSNRSCFFLRLSFGGSGLLQQAAPAFFLQAIAVAADRDHVAVVKQAIEDGSRHHRITEHRRMPQLLIG